MSLSNGNTKIASITLPGQNGNPGDVYDLSWNKTSDTEATLQLSKNGTVVWTHPVNLDDATQDVNVLVADLIANANEFLASEVAPAPVLEPTPTFADTLEVLVVKLCFSIQENGVPFIQLGA
jgi:hypothetical protein